MFLRRRFWEEIVVQNDEYYENKNVIYYHCSNCSKDFRVEELETAKILQFKINPAELKIKQKQTPKVCFFIFLINVKFSYSF